MFSRRNLLAATLLASVFVLPHSAMASLDEPSDTVVLRLGGAISETNMGDEAVFDRSMLRDIDWQTVKSFTPFTEGEQTFSGPLLKAVLDEVGADGTALEAFAINDYMVEITLSDVIENGAILAMEHNGTPMRIRDRGPIWIIFPADEAQAEARLFASEMIWQLSRIVVN